MDEINIKNDGNKENYLNLLLINDYFRSKNDKQNKDINLEKYNNIYIKYLKNPNFIFEDKENLENNNIILLFKQINNDIDNGNNIIFPFLNICPNLVKAYIESNLDDENIDNNENKIKASKIKESFYLKVFEKLKNNCFISKEILFPIYDYFKKLYDIVTNKIESKDNDIVTNKIESKDNDIVTNKIESKDNDIVTNTIESKDNNIVTNKMESKDNDIVTNTIESKDNDIVTNKIESKDNDVIFKKFDKMIRLFEIFYESNNIKEKNKSSFCFIGGNITIEFNKVLQSTKINVIDIEIFFLNYDYFEHLNDNSNIMKINEYEIKYKDIKGKIDLNKPKVINIRINENIIFKFNDKMISIPAKLKNIKTISLLEDFYGQISSIKISLLKEKEIIDYNFQPFSIRDDNTIYYIKKNILSNNATKSYIDNDIIPKIIINDKNLVNVNYINYNDKKLNIIDYFGGIIQFLPFHIIFKNLSEKNNIYITKEKINQFLNFLIKRIIDKLFSLYQWKKIFKKYAFFVYCLLLEQNFDLDNFLVDYEDERNKDNAFYYIELLTMIYYNQINSKSENELEQVINNRDNKDKTDLNFFVYTNKTIKQLYKEYMKSLFCFNNYWSNRNIYFPKKYSNEIPDLKSEIKYKQLNYYTKNFQLPYLYPILEYSKYYPNFSLYKGEEKLFKENNRNILEYNFKLEIKSIDKNTLKHIFSNNSHGIALEKCCVVKNTHHIFGELFLIKKKNNQNGKNFKLLFKKINKNIKNSENINENINDKGESNNEISNDFVNINNDFCFINKKANLCYGSVFSCPERECIRNIMIKSKDILFLLIRVYYHRVSGVEIFTINKSYYFNFQNNFDINNLKQNKILNEIINNPFFKKIKMKNEKLTIGYYNIKYKSYLFPLFEDEINNWDKKINYYSNYDILSIINIFSNRTYRDVFQYPIFPALYDLIDIKRELNEHIGLQENIPQSIKRRDLFLKTFISNDEDKEINEDMFIFNIHYSNPAFVFNYLLRIFPYTLLSIEFQGDSFDDPNRLFFSVEKTLRSSLQIKSDLREMIPELYYMIELFYNKNNILFDKIYDGTLIDDVSIKDNENIPANKKLENYAKFIYNMRKNLEDRHINKWIDLIFGYNQEYYIMDNKKFKYYDDNSLIKFETDQKKFDNELSLDMVSFGLVPYQLFSNKKFPSIRPKDKGMLNKINNLNKELFKDEHIKINSPIQSFLCKGRILIDDNYIKLINPKAQIYNLENYFNIPDSIAQKITKKLKNESIFYNPFNSIDIENEQNKDKFKDKTSLVNYYFVGDIYGNILIYSLNANTDENDKNKDFIEDNNEIFKYGSFEIMSDKEVHILKDYKNFKEMFNLTQNRFEIKIKNYNFQVKLFKILTNHTKEIKYIDFNARLKILLSYSFDDFINIYIFPKFKLINVIDINSFRNEDDKNIFDEVVLISFPFPSIICHNKNYIYNLTINGDLIKFQKLEENDKIVYSIDKNLGIVQDKIEIFNSEGILKNTFNNFI